MPLSGLKILHLLFRYVSKFANGVLILFARFEPISAKHLLKIKVFGH